MSKGKFALGAVVAAAAGFVAGILTAPKSGKETRDEIKDKAVKTKDTVVDEAVKAKGAAELKGKELKAKAEEIVEDVKSKVTEVADDVTEKATEYKGRAEQAVDGAKKGFNKKPKATKKK